MNQNTISAATKPTSPDNETASSTDRQELVPVGLRVPRSLLVVAKTVWISGGDRYGTVCQQIVESALGGLSSSVPLYLKSLEEGEDLPVVVEPYRVDEEAELQQITVRLTPEAYRVAKVLSLETGSIPKVCEPLLCQELYNRIETAMDRIRSLLQELEAVKETHDE